MTKKEIIRLILFLVFCFVTLKAFSINPGLGAIVFAGGILLVLIHGIYSIQQIKRNGATTTGVVIDIETDKNGGQTPVVEFEIPSGEKISGTPFVSSSFRISGVLLNKQQAGEVSVLYNRNDPHKFILPDHSGQNTIFLIVMVLFALAFLGLGIYEYFYKGLSSP